MENSEQNLKKDQSKNHEAFFVRHKITHVIITLAG